MKLTDYYDWLAELALGWLGWTEQQTLETDVNAILVGYFGKVEMLKLCFGVQSKLGNSKTPTTLPVGGGGKTVKMSPRLFDTLFK